MQISRAGTARDFFDKAGLIAIFGAFATWQATAMRPRLVSWGRTADADKYLDRAAHIAAFVPRHGAIIEIAPRPYRQ
jgi:hypothetical protein